MRDETIINHAKELLIGKVHFLARLATNAVSVHYAIEENISSRHIYFSKPLFAKDVYEQYSKYLTDNLVILRVKISAVTGLVDDPSEDKAWMTQAVVPPDKIEIMTKHDQSAPGHSGVKLKCFSNEEYRIDAKNWVALKDWEEKPAAERRHIAADRGAPLGRVVPDIYIEARPISSNPSDEVYFYTIVHKGNEIGRFKSTQAARLAATQMRGSDPHFLIVVTRARHQQDRNNPNHWST